MSRSFKRAPVVGNAGAASERDYKRMEHQRERAGVRDALRQGLEPPSPRRYGDPALGPKDGKCYAEGIPKVRRK